MIYEITINFIEDGIGDFKSYEIFADQDYKLNYEAYLEAIKEELENVVEISKENGVHSYESVVRLMGKDIVNDNNWITIHKSDIKFVKTR